MTELSLRITAADYRALRGLPSAGIPEVSESAFLARIIAYARQCGWLVYHVHDSRRSAPGFPDLTLTRPGRLIFAEVKTAKGKLTVEQDQWLAVLQRSVQRVEVYMWRPADWPQIQDILR